ncbi:MAG: hypothetical protein ACYC5Y_04835 [Symbiobacteriia bacterium]
MNYGGYGTTFGAFPYSKVAIYPAGKGVPFGKGLPFGKGVGYPATKGYSSSYVIPSTTVATSPYGI